MLGAEGNNPCKGCGHCCKDISIYDDESTLMETFPEAKEVSSWKLHGITRDGGEDGVYYSYYGGEEGMAEYRIVGTCPNQKPDGRCGRYQRCSRAAEKFKVGSTECNEIRQEHGLLPLKTEQS